MANAANSKLINSLSTSSIKNQISPYLTDDKLSFAETKQFLTSFEQGGMTATKFKDLNTLW